MLVLKIVVINEQVINQVDQANPNPNPNLDQIWSRFVVATTTVASLA